MFWLFKKFGALIGLTGLFIGALFIPADFLDRENALRAWGQVFSVGNREIFLAILVFVCLARLAYLDFRRAVNDRDWPPVRTKLLRFGAFIFRRDARLAQLSTITNDAAVRAYKASLMARTALERGNWAPIPAMPAPPYKTPEEAAASLVGDYWYDLLNQDLPGVQIEVAVAPISMDAEELMKSTRRRLDVAALRAQDNKQDWPRHEAGGFFPNEDIRNRWHARRAQIEEVNRIKVQIKQCLERARDNWSSSIDEETRSQLLRDIAEETQS